MSFDTPPCPPGRAGAACRPGTIGRSQLLSRQQISFQLSVLARAVHHPLWAAAAENPRLVPYSMFQLWPAKPGCRLPRGLSGCTFPERWTKSSSVPKFCILRGVSGPLHECWTSRTVRPHCSTGAAATKDSSRAPQPSIQTVQQQRQSTTFSGPGLKLNEQQQRAAQASKDLALVVVAGRPLILLCVVCPVPGE